MSENTPETGGTPPVEQSAPAEPEKAARYSAYDKTYLRFVGDVHDTRKAAIAEARAAKVESFEIRTV